MTPAELLLQELGVSEPADIDLVAIAWHAGARVRYRPLDGCEARILGYGDRAIITINTRSGSRRRQRFSLGHELGHWHHHKGRSFVCRSDDIGDQKRSFSDPERVADRYAADLLMPRYLFEAAAKRLQPMDMEAVRSLADAFDTSLTATAIRYVGFGPVPAMLVCHGVKGRKWFARGPDVPRALFPRQELDHESFAFDALFAGKSEPRPRLIGADAWFDRRGSSRFELYEHSTRTTDDEILTLLHWKDESMLEDAA